MPQVDLEAIVSVCSGGSSTDRKIACETLAADTSNTNHRPSDSEPDPPDLPPYSFWLSKDAELDWFDQNAFIERKDSTKGSNSTNLNPSTSNSQRFSNVKKPKVSFFGLPKPQKAFDSKNRRNCKPENTRLFPKRSGSTTKSDSNSVIEPSSPKVSCMGRVRSKRDRNRRLRNRQRRNQSKERELDSEKSLTESKKKPGFFATFRTIFIFTRKPSKDKKLAKNKSQTNSFAEASTLNTHEITEKLPRKSVGLDEPAKSEPVGLGGMKRFASGRRSELLGMNSDVA